MHKTFALKLILLINQGYLGVIHRHCHADTYTDNSFDEDNYRQDGPTVSVSHKSTRTAVTRPAVSSTGPRSHARARTCSSAISSLSASVGPRSCSPSHANLFNNVRNPSSRQLFAIAAQYHSKKNPFLFALSTPYPTSPPTPPPLSPSAVCTAAVG